MCVCVKQDVLGQVYGTVQVRSGIWKSTVLDRYMEQYEFGEGMWDSVATTSYVE